MKGGVRGTMGLLHGILFHLIVQSPAHVMLHAFQLLVKWLNYPAWMLETREWAD